MNDAELSPDLLIDAVADYAIFMLDTRGVVTSANKGAEKLKGYRAGDIVGQHFSAFYTDEDRQSGVPDRSLAACERGGSFEDEGWRIRKDGSRFWANVAIHQMRDPAGKLVGYVKITRDLTERRSADDALRESEEQFRLLVETVTDHAIYRLDAHGQIISWNKGAEVLKGYRPYEIIGHHFSKFYTDEDRRREEPERGLDIARRRGRFESQGWRVRKDGSTFWADVVIHPIRNHQGATIGFAKVTRDITARRAAENDLRDSERRLKLVTDHIPGLISNLDTPLRYRFANQAYADWFGVDPASLTGMSVRDFYGESVFAGIAPALQSALRGHVVIDERDIMAGGELRHCHVALVPQRDEAGKVVGLFAIQTDITQRKKAELALRASQDFLARTGAVAGVGGWEVDLLDGSVTWSDEVCRLHDLAPGYRPTVEEAIGFYAPASRPIIEQAVRDGLERGEPWDLELELFSAKGRRFWARATGAVEFKDGEPVRLVGAFQDVTDRVTTQRQLLEQTTNLKATLDTIEQGVLKVAPDGRVTLTNQRYLDLLDIPPQLFEGGEPSWRSVLDYLDARGEFARTDAVTYDRIRNAPQTLGTFERLRPDGRTLEVRVAPVADGSVMVTYTDITARRHAEKGVRDSEARYRMLADTTSDVITQLDLDLVRRYVSPACRTTLGYEPDEMIGITPSILIHPDDAEPVRNLMELLVAGAVPGDRATVTNRMRHKQGHWVWLEAGINLVRDAETGAPRSLICSLRDVTERQRAARHLERAKMIAEDAARIKADFVANMSHELRTPLTGILGVHDLLKADSNLTSRQRRYLDLAYNAGQSLLIIVNDVLDFSKIEAGQLSIERIPFDLDEMVTACRDFANAEARKKSLEIGLHLAGGGSTLVGDPNRLRQIILNLLTNAVKFTERGGVKLDVRYDKAAARLRVEVSDTGIGIAPDKIPLLFGRFSQADASITRRYGGTGLGLAICKRLIELMGGDIGVTSEPGLGTTFFFELPLSSSPSGTQELPHPDDRPTLRPRHVLLAEDNLVNQEMIVAMIENRGHKVTAVNNGVAAVEAAQAGDFDIILMDMQMPVLDGLSAARSIRASETAQGRPAIPIVGLTANALAEDINRCREAGMEAHVAKPIEWTELFTTMDRLTVKPNEEVTPAVLEHEKLTDLARYIGQERLNRMLERFVVEVEHRLKALGSSSVAALADDMHTLKAMAGQFGFMELATLCTEVEGEARQGAGLNRLPDFDATAQRAIAAAKSSIAGG